MKKGVISKGIKCPIFRQGDDLVELIYNSIKADGHVFQDKDIIGITESVVARTQGNYVTVDDIVQFLEARHFSKYIFLYRPIMSRNRFSLILKAFARYATKIHIFVDKEYDEQGNPTFGINQFTGVNIMDYYTKICTEENCEIAFTSSDVHKENYMLYIDARCHPDDKTFCNISLKNIMNEPIIRKDGSKSGFNSQYGLLGSNKADDETLKLFPNKEETQELIEKLQQKIKNDTGKNVEVMVYGDGCFKDPVGGIWEFADPVTTPAYTSGLEGTPNEIKLKAFADGKYKNLSGQELQDAINKEIENKNNNLVGNMASQGTTPRRYIDLLASLMDLTSGSGDRATPVVIVQNYL